MVSHLNSFRYIEMDGEFIETPFQHFEEVLPIAAAAETAVEENVPLRMASLKDARAVVQKGECANWGRLPDFTQKTDKFGLGFTAEGQKAMRKAKTRRPPVLITNPGVNVVGEDNEVDEAEFNSWIYPTTNGGLTNWIAKDHTPVTFVTQ